VCRELEQARKLALKRGQTTAAISATLAKAKIAGLLADKPEDMPQRPVTFDGNYNEAALRISLLLRLSEKQKSEGGGAIVERPSRPYHQQDEERRARNAR
jgi:hypothetical protein